MRKIENFQEDAPASALKPSIKILLREEKKDLSTAASRRSLA